VNARAKQILNVAVVVLFVASSAPAQPTSDAADSAKAIAHLLEQHYRNAQTLRAVFLERYSEGPRQAQVESGTVYFRRPGRMRWEYDSPEKKLFLVDGKTVWFYVPYDHTVTKAPVRESSDWRTPLALLTGKADLLRLCSRLDLAVQSGVPSGHVILRCLPKGEKPSPAQSGSHSSSPTLELSTESDFTEVMLEVDRASGELARIEIRQPGGIELEYRFGDWQEDKPLPESMFQFHVPEGVAIVDASELPSGPQ
jgi:outer membrane lipoprotein carrier protein